MVEDEICCDARMSVCLFYAVRECARLSLSPIAPFHFSSFISPRVPEKKRAFPRY